MEDARRYRQALLRPEDAAACAPIVGDDVRGECEALAHGARAATDPAAAEAGCAAMAPGPWREECFFLVADTVGAFGAEALRLCGQAGGLSTPCRGHALSRAASGPLAAMDAVGGVATLGLVEGLVIELFGPHGARGRAERLVVESLSRRQPEDPFAAAWCGDLPTALCSSAYEERVRAAARLRYPGEAEGWRAACARVVSAERVVAVGLPAYAPDAEALAVEVWQGLCRRG